MIVSASYRTDIPAFYASWFLRRLGAGHCRVANPYGGDSYEVSLAPGEVDGFVLWSRNLRPLIGDLDAVRRVAPFTVQFTVTGYPRALENSVIAAAEAVGQLRELRRRFGPRVAVWRYDPIVFTRGLDGAAHAARFAALARALNGTVDEVVLSVMHPYKKTRRNLDRAAARSGFAWRDPPDEEKRQLLLRLAAIAREEGMAPTLCSQPELLGPAILGGLAEARCIDAERLGDVAQQPIAARIRGNRPGCRCALSRDIGAYDTCPHGCVYCYAVADRDRTVANFRSHDPDAATLRASCALPAGPCENSGGLAEQLVETQRRAALDQPIDLALREADCHRGMEARQAGDIVELAHNAAEREPMRHRAALEIDHLDHAARFASLLLQPVIERQAGEVAVLARH